MKVLVVAAAAAILTATAANALTFPDGTDTSTVSLRRFKDISNDSTQKDAKGCQGIGSLPVTVKAGSDFSAEMTPPDFVTPVVKRNTLYFNLNDDFVNYKGKAGVIVTVPSGSLEDIDASISAIFNILPGASTSKESIDIDASTSATVYLQGTDDEDIDIDASTSAMVVVLGTSGNDDMEVDIDASTSASVYVAGANDVEVDDASTSASISLTGSNLEKLDIDDIGTSATLFAEFTSGSKMEIDDISTSAEVTVTGLDRIKIKDSFMGTLITDSQSNCDSVSDLTSGTFSTLTCTVDKSITAPEAPDVPTTVVYDIDLSNNICNVSN